MQRMKDQQKHTAEREANEREKFMLKVENLILKADRQLPPSSGKVNAEDEEQVLKLKGIRFWCDQHTPQRDEEVLQIFEREVIEKLRAK